MMPADAYYYASHVLGGRYPEGEAVIARDSHYACFYAADVLQGRFPLGEAVIARDPYYAYLYALYVIGKRWKEAESVIFNSVYVGDYCEHFGIKPEKANWVVEGF